MNKPSILVVDDDQSTRQYLTHFLSSRGYRVACLDSGDGILGRLTANPPSVMILDLRMPGVSGLDVLAQVRTLERPAPVIVVSALGEINTVVKAMKMGASDYLVKPFEEQELELAIENVLEKHKLSDEVKSLRRQLHQSEIAADIISSNPKMLRIREIAAQVAATDVPVLILGESGVGKEVVARFIHEQSNRSEGPFVKVNCAALPHELLESELFGYERGAFTGAIRDKIGKFEQADKGTLLLDEIGEMSPHLQAKLLHVLQDSEFSRLGGKKPVRVNVRILAATNKKLKEAVLKGEFRNDLYFRLNVIKLEIPPLRERREDIPLLCNHFLEEYRERYQSPVQQIPKELMELLLRYDWPGNVRQLENVVKRYLILPDADIVSELKSASTEAVAVMRPGNVSLKEVAGHAAEVAEKEVVLRMLEETGWNRKESARRLRISYKALRNKLKKWQLVRERPSDFRTLVKSA